MLPEVLYDLALTGAYLALFVYMGAPVARFLGLDGRQQFGVSGALLGLSLTSVLAWTWSLLTGRGIQPVLFALVLINAVPFALTIWRSRGLRPDRRGLASMALLAGLTIAVLAYGFRDVLGTHVLAASQGNSDLPLYAIVAKHLVHHGLDDPGNIQGLDLGHHARVDYFGAFAMLGSLSSLTSIEPARFILPMIIACQLLLVFAIRGLLGQIGGIGPTARVVIAVAACSSSLQIHTAGHGFIAQMLAMPLFVHLVRRSQGDPTWGSWPPTRRIVENGLYVAGLLSIYPHMALLGLPVLIGVSLLAHLLQRASVRELLRAGLIPVASLGVASVLVWPRVMIAVDNTFAAGGTTAGWALPRVSLAQAVGLGYFPDTPNLGFRAPDHHAALASISWRLVAAFAIVTVVVLLLAYQALDRQSAGRRHAMAWSLSLALVPLVSYYALYGYLGPTYQQWKWISFFQPPLTAGLLALVWLLLRGTVGGPRWIALGAAWTWLIGMGVAVLTVPTPVHPLRLTSASTVVSSDPDVHKSAAVNVSVGTDYVYWDTMWAAYFMLDKKVLIQSDSYFPKSPRDPNLPTVTGVTATGSHQLP